MWTIRLFTGFWGKGVVGMRDVHVLTKSQAVAFFKTMKVALVQRSGQMYTVVLSD